MNPWWLVLIGAGIVTAIVISAAAVALIIGASKVMTLIKETFWR